MKILVRCNGNGPTDRGTQEARNVSFTGTRLHDGAIIEPAIENATGGFTVIGDRVDDIDFNYGDEVEVTFKVVRTAAEVKAAFKKAQEEKEAAEKLAAEKTATSSTLQPPAAVS